MQGATHLMKSSKNSLVLAAAFAGLLSGTAARVSAAPSDSSATVGIAGLLADNDAKKVEKHGCKGLNSCKGNGGCSSGDNGCAGKNSCKGKGGCATDGKMDTKKK
jgi:hypothetical protein